MPDREKQTDDLPDARNDVLYQNDTFTIGPHRKVKSNNNYVAVVNKELTDKYPTFMDILNAPNTKPLHDLFNAIAGGMTAHAQKHGAGKNNKVFWLINVTDDRLTDKNNTHSKGSYPHTHIIYGPLPKDYEYSYVLDERTYTPNSKQEHEKSTTISTRIQFKNFQDFVQNADENDYKILKTELLLDLAEQIPSGGVRLVCDEFNNHNWFELRIQMGDQGHKWFERPEQPQP